MLRTTICKKDFRYLQTHLKVLKQKGKQKKQTFYNMGDKENEIYPNNSDSQNNNWKTVGKSITSWSFGLAGIGSLHALKTGKPFLATAISFFGYGFVVSSAFFVSREVLFGEDIRIYKRVDNMHGRSFQTYPVTYTAVSGALTGAVAGALTGVNINRTITGAVIVSALTSSFHIGSNLVRTFLPELLSSNTQTQRVKRNKPEGEEFLWRKKIPSWSPIQVYSKEENQERERRTLEAAELEKDVELLRYKVETLKRVKEIYEAKQSRTSA